MVPSAGKDTPDMINAQAQSGGRKLRRNAGWSGGAVRTPITPQASDWAANPTMRNDFGSPPGQSLWGHLKANPDLSTPLAESIYTSHPSYTSNTGLSSRSSSADARLLLHPRVNQPTMKTLLSETKSSSTCQYEALARGCGPPPDTAILFFRTLLASIFGW